MHQSSVRDLNSRAPWARLRLACFALCGAAALGVACSDDDGGTDGGACGGPVAGMNDEDHCVGVDGMPIEQEIGMCSTNAEEPEHEEGEEHEEEEEHEPFFGRSSVDDDCKYQAS